MRPSYVADQKAGTLNEGILEPLRDELVARRLVLEHDVVAVTVRLRLQHLEQ